MRQKKQFPTTDVVEFARQPNEIARASFNGTAASYRIIIYALYNLIKLQNPIDIKENSRFLFSCKEFCKHMGIKYNSTHTINQMVKAIKELIKSYLKLDQKDASTGKTKQFFFPFFTVLSLDMRTGEVEGEFNVNVISLLDYKDFSKIELLEFGQLESFYAQRFYSLARSTQGFAGKGGNAPGEWYFEYTEEEIKKLVTTPENEDTLFSTIHKGEKSPRRDVFVRSVIKKPCKEVSEKTAIKIIPQATKIDKGKYRWTFLCSYDAANAPTAKKTRKKSVKTLEDEFFVKYRDEYNRYYEIAEKMGGDFCTIDKVKQSVINTHPQEWEQIHGQGDLFSLPF